MLVDPPASVVLDSARRSRARPERPDDVWYAAPPPLTLPAPEPAGPGRPVAYASVDESDVYGLRLFGVPVRARPEVAAVRVASVSHGDRLGARCWADGDLVSNGFAAEPFNEKTYQSAIWFFVAVGSRRGYIPDVRFGRRGGLDRLGLPRCDLHRTGAM